MTEDAATPRVSIGLPVYNGADYLREALDALVAQTFEDFELIISDNASTDETQAICEDYAARDARIRYDRLPENVGAAGNYNRLPPMARGEFFKWAAHDDNCHPAYLASCVGALDHDPEAVLVYPSTYVIDGEGAIMRDYRDGLDLPQDTPHARLVAYLRANFMRKKGLCNPIFGLIRTAPLHRTRLIQDFLSSDRSLLGHLALLGKFIELPEILFDRRVHTQISTFADRSFSARRAWFAAGSGARRSRFRFNNYLGLRMTHIRDFYRAIGELVDDPAERRRCRRSLTRLLATDPKWVYIDIKYSLGLRPSQARIMADLKKT